jgi:hypothetical protein
VEALSEDTHEGLRFVGGASLGPGDAAVSRVVDAARYVVGIPRADVEARGGVAWLQDRTRAALEARELVVVRRIDGLGKRVDVREYLRALAVSWEQGRAALAAAGVTGDLVPVAVDVDIRGSGGVKVTEVMEAAFGAEMPGHPVRFTLGLRADGDVVLSPLALAAVRARRGTAPAAPEPTGVTGPSPESSFAR